MEDQTNTATPGEWVLLEVFGHRRHWGLLTEVERFGAKLARIDEFPPEATEPTATSVSRICWARRPPCGSCRASRCWGRSILSTRKASTRTALLGVAVGTNAGAWASQSNRR